MNITQVKVFPVHEDKLKAFVSVVFDHAFMVNDIKVIQGKDGLFLSMPSRRKKNGEFKDVAHPLNNETRRMLEERVLAEYRQVVDDPTPRRPDRQADPGLGPGPAAEPISAPERPAQPAEPEVVSSDVVIGAGDAVAKGEKSLEEVQEIHLRDSFWSVS